MHSKLTRPVGPRTGTRGGGGRKWDIFAIAASFGLLLIAPLKGDAAVTCAVLIGLALCCWTPRGCLFMLLASSTVYVKLPDGGVFVTTMTIGRIIALFMLFRCLISPGIASIGAVFRSLDRRGLAMLVCYVLITLVAGVYTGSLKTNLDVISIAGIVIAVVCMLPQLREEGWLVYVLVLALLLLPLCQLMVQAGLIEASGGNEQLIAGQVVERVSGARQDSNYVGTAMGVLVSMTLALYFLSPSLPIRLLSAVIAGGTMMPLLSTGSRGAVVVAGGGCALVVILAMMRDLRSFLSRGFIAGIVLILVMAIKGGVVLEDAQAVILRFLSSGGELGRGEIWSDGLRYIIEHPLGDLDGWMSFYLLEPHNAFLMAGLEGGILAMLSLVGVTALALLRGLRRVYQARNSQDYFNAVLYVGLFTSCMSIFSFAMLRHYQYWVCVLFFISLRQPHPDEAQARAPLGAVGRRRFQW